MIEVIYIALAAVKLKPEKTFWPERDLKQYYCSAVPAEQITN